MHSDTDRRAARRRARSGRARCSSPGARCTMPRPRCSRRARGLVATDARSGRRRHRRVRRRPARRRRHTRRRASRGAEIARGGDASTPGPRRPGSRPRSTSTPTARSRSDVTSRSSRSTPRPARCGLVRHVAVDDCGRVVNPMLAEAQVHGGIAQGVAQALFERGRLRRRRQPAHREPARLRRAERGRAAVVRGVAHRHAHAAQPLGAKGIGESGTTGSTAAVWNAVVDALRPYGVVHLDMPFTPERVWRAIHRGESRARSSVTDV